MDGEAFLLHTHFHIRVIKFIIWPTAALACDYPGYPMERGGVYVLRTKDDHVGHLNVCVFWGGCRRDKNNTEAFNLAALAREAAPSQSASFLLLLANNSFLALLFAKIQVTMATMRGFISTSSLI